MDEHCCTCSQAERVGILQVAEQVLARSGSEFHELHVQAAALLVAAFKDSRRCFPLPLPSFPRE